MRGAAQCLHGSRRRLRRQRPPRREAAPIARVTRPLQAAPRRTTAPAPPRRDSVVYSATCPKLGGAAVALKVYDKARISANKSRSVRREARIMRFLTDAR